MITILDYNVGNIGSLKNALEYIGCSVEVVSNQEGIDKAKVLVIPGVGSFDGAINNIHSFGVADSIKSGFLLEKPMLGICVGMQVFCKASEEGVLEGLGVVDVKLEHLSALGCHSGVPHVGFNSVCDAHGDFGEFQGFISQDFYFVHSYAIHQKTNSTFEFVTEHGGVFFTSAFAIGSFLGCQFHPEKSGEVGLNFLETFVRCSKSA